MEIPDDPIRVRRLLCARLKQLGARGPLVTASLTESRRTCGRPGCRCYRGEKHVSHRLTFKQGGRTRSVYVPVELVDEVKGWAAEGCRLRRLMREANQLAIALIRARARGRKRRRAKQASSAERCLAFAGGEGARPEAGRKTAMGAAAS